MNKPLLNNENELPNPKIILTNSKLSCSIEFCEDNSFQMIYFTFKKRKHQILSKYRFPKNKITQWGVELQKNKKYLFFVELDTQVSHVINDLSFKDADETCSFLIQYF